MQMKREPKAEAEKPSGNVEGAETPGCSQQPVQGRARRAVLVVLCECLFNTDME